MALIRCDFFAESIDQGTSMTVVLPQAEGGVAEPPPVLYLLHGLGDNDTAWTRFTSIERYADDHGLAVVMPQVHRSFYADEAHGAGFWTFLSEELPRVVSQFFRMSTRREDTFVAGLSMGGYGAFKWALRDPSRFAAAASLSAPLDIVELQRTDDRPHIREIMARVFDDRDLAGTGDDLIHLLGTHAPAELPRLLLRCGTEDHTLRYNERFVAACAAHGVALDSGFAPGAHEWAYWDAEIRAVLEWLRPANG